MDATTELNGVIQRDHADLLTVFVAEEHQRAALFGLVHGADVDVRGDVAQHGGVDLALNRGELVGLHRLEVGEVKAQPIGLHQGAALLDVTTKDVAQGLMQQVCGRVVRPHARTVIGVDGGLNHVTHV